MGSIIGTISGFMRGAGSGIKSYINEYLKQRQIPKIQTSNDNVAELFFIRDYLRQDIWDQADAILTRVLRVPEARVVWVVGQLETVKNSSKFNIAPNVEFQIVDTKIDNKGFLEYIHFKLCSETYTVCELRDYVNNLVEEYLIDKKNNLGTKIFYFDHIVEKTNSRIPSPQKVLFSKHLFCTNRTLDNVFHERQEELKQRVEFFLNRKDWYDKRGIPHTLGLLLHGPPGTGKTSTIKAIANIAKRHIINIDLGSVKTKKQLKKLFYDERLEVCENMGNTNNISEYIIPIDRRLYVIEDIDAIDSELVLKRTSDNITYIEEPQHENNSGDTSDLDLATILNIIDGTLETPGRILIISSNYPEKLDEALIRPGRIDMLLEYKKCNHTMLHDMFVSFFEKEPDPNTIKDIPEYTWTPAEVCQLLFKNFGNPDAALAELVEIDPKVYFKFSHTDRLPMQSDLPQQSPPKPEPKPEPQPEPKPEPVQPLIPINSPALDMMDEQDISNLMGDDGGGGGSLTSDQSVFDEEGLGVERSVVLAELMSMEHIDISDALQRNTHTDTYTLMNGYTPSQSGYALAGLD